MMKKKLKEGAPPTKHKSSPKKQDNPKATPKSKKAPPKASSLKPKGSLKTPSQGKTPSKALSRPARKKTAGKKEVSASSKGEASPLKATQETALSKATPLLVDKPPQRRSPFPKRSFKKQKPKQTSPVLEENKKEEKVEGTIRIHPRGFGFVIVEKPEEFGQDIFIPKHLTQQALDGDKVEVLVNTSATHDKGPEGKVISILRRSRELLLGILIADTPALIAHVPILGAEKPLTISTKGNLSLKLGDRILLKVLNWADKGELKAEAIHNIGSIETASADTEAAIYEYNLPHVFSKAALAEATTLGKEVPQQELQQRKDLTKTLCLTIDPTTAKDFDDALSLTKDPKGHFFLGVHIADVAHYIQTGSALDIDALARCNSTYFPGKCLPMLPPALSDNLCSLKQGEIRLTVSVFMEFNQQGELLSSQIERSFIKSRCRFTYEEALHIIEGKKESPYKENLLHMTELCILLKKQRSLRGSIDFALPELVIEVDETGNPLGIHIEQYHIAHQLVEECMLKANEVVAKTLSDRNKLPLFRIHEEPSGKDLEDFFGMAESCGFIVPSSPTTKDIQDLFQAAKETPFMERLSVAFIRSLKLATYSQNNIGHFGLQLEYYCHFTSPIRRYSDLITQRLLFGDLPCSIELDKMAQKCSEQERVSFRAESSVKLLKKLRLLKKWKEEEQARVYTARITKIKPFGLFFEMHPLNLEGFLHISELDNDYFIYESKGSFLRGRESKKLYQINQEISVIPLSVNLIYADVSWRLFGGRK